MDPRPERTSQMADYSQSRVPAYDVGQYDPEEALSVTYTIVPAVPDYVVREMNEVVDSVLLKHDEAIRGRHVWNSFDVYYRDGDARLDDAVRMDAGNVTVHASRRALMDLLGIPEDRRHPWHVVDILPSDPGGWQVAHPITCQLADCILSLQLAAGLGQAMIPGRYRWQDNEWAAE